MLQTSPLRVTACEFSPASNLQDVKTQAHHCPFLLKNEDQKRNNLILQLIDQPNTTGRCCYGLGMETAPSEPTRTTPVTAEEMRLQLQDSYISGSTTVETTVP